MLSMSRVTVESTLCKLTRPAFESLFIRAVAGHVRVVALRAAPRRRVIATSKRLQHPCANRVLPTGECVGAMSVQALDLILKTKAGDASIAQHGGVAPLGAKLAVFLCESGPACGGIRAVRRGEGRRELRARFGCDAGTDSNVSTMLANGCCNDGRT